MGAGETGMAGYVGYYIPQDPLEGALRGGSPQGNPHGGPRGDPLGETHYIHLIDMALGKK